MANFHEAHQKTLKFEGGYSKDPDDAGGETYMGISRVYNPSWYGWTLIDQEKNESDFPSCLEGDEDLYDAVEDFYKDKYWDVNRLDAYDSQAVAEEMFDTGVNMGVGRAARFLQTSLNYLNRNGLLYNKLVVDGAIGPASLNALQIVLDDGDEIVLLSMLNTLQGRHYMDYMDKSPSQKKYARGWFSRVKM